MKKAISELTDEELLAELRKGNELEFDLNLIIVGIPPKSN